MLAVLGLIIGLALLAYGVLAYTGSSMMASLPAALRRPNDALWLAGIVLLALAALGGVLGSLIATDLKLIRILLGIGGLVLLGLAWPRATTPVA